MGAFMTNDKKLKTARRRFELTVAEAGTHKLLWGRVVSLRQVVVMAVSASILIAALVFAIVAFTPLRTLIPGYPNASTRRITMQNAVRIDSLEREILHWQLYTENLRRVVAGEEPLKLDSLILQRGSSISEDTPYDPELDSLLRARLNALDYEEVADEITEE